MATACRYVALLTSGTIAFEAVAGGLVYVFGLQQQLNAFKQEQDIFTRLSEDIEHNYSSLRAPVYQPVPPPSPPPPPPPPPPTPQTTTNPIFDLLYLLLGNTSPLTLFAATFVSILLLLQLFTNLCTIVRYIWKQMSGPLKLAAQHNGDDALFLLVWQIDYLFLRFGRHDKNIRTTFANICDGLTGLFPKANLAAIKRHDAKFLRPDSAIMLDPSQGELRSLLAAQDIRLADPPETLAPNGGTLTGSREHGMTTEPPWAASSIRQVAARRAVNEAVVLLQNDRAPYMHLHRQLQRLVRCLDLTLVEQQASHVQSMQLADLLETRVDYLERRYDDLRAQNANASHDAATLRLRCANHLPRGLDQFPGLELATTDTNWLVINGARLRPAQAVERSPLEQNDILAHRLDVDEDVTLVDSEHILEVKSQHQSNSTLEQPSETFMLSATKETPIKHLSVAQETSPTTPCSLSSPLTPGSGHHEADDERTEDWEDEAADADDTLSPSPLPSEEKRKKRNREHRRGRRVQKQIANKALAKARALPFFDVEGFGDDGYWSGQMFGSGDLDEQSFNMQSPRVQKLELTSQQDALAAPEKVCQSPRMVAPRSIVFGCVAKSASEPATPTGSIGLVNVPQWPPQYFGRLASKFNNPDVAEVAPKVEADEPVRNTGITAKVEITQAQGMFASKWSGPVDAKMDIDSAAKFDVDQTWGMLASKWSDTVDAKSDRGPAPNVDVMQRQGMLASKWSSPSDAKTGSGPAPTINMSMPETVESIGPSGASVRAAAAAAEAAAAALPWEEKTDTAKRNARRRANKKARMQLLNEQAADVPGNQEDVEIS